VPSNDAPKDEARLVEHWKAQGTDLTLGPVTRYARLLGDPYDTVVPDATLDEIGEWLSAAYPEKRQQPKANTASSDITLGGRAGTHPFRDIPVLFGEAQRTFGILTKPDSPAQRSHPAVFFLNVGANHHIGPHRLWVDLARELAALDYAAFRFDAPGLGDSLVTPGRENRIYSDDFVRDVRRAMDVLGERYGIDRFVLVGLCSGAYLSFRTAIEDPRVAGQVLFNTHTFAWKEGDPVKPTLSRRYYAESLADRRVWVRVLRGEVNFRFIANVFLTGLRKEATTRLQPLRARLRGEPEPPSVRSEFEKLSARGVESLLVFSTIDGGLDMLASHFGQGARKMRRYPSFAIEIVDGVDHVFTQVASQRILSGILTKYMTSRFR
jgi:pimeloyl-ACP methyl ester carboxylesterase